MSMNDMKLIMERFEAFSEKTLLQEQKKLSIIGTGWFGQFERDGYRKIYRTIRASYEKTYGQGMNAKRGYKDEYTKKWYKEVHYVNMRSAARDASKATPVKQGDDPVAIAKQYAKNLVMQLEKHVPFFSRTKFKNAWRMANRAAVGYLRPYFTAAIKKMLQPAGAEPAGVEPEQPNIGMPNPNPGKKIDKTTQKKIDITGRIIKKYGFLGTKDVGRGAQKLNTMLKKYGAAPGISAIAPSTISAVYKFQKAYNKKYPREITVDGLFGGQTNRAYKRMESDAKKADAKKPDAKKPDAEKAKADEKK